MNDDFEFEEVKQLVGGLVAILAEGIAAGDTGDEKILETLTQLDLQYSEYPDSILVLLKASLILGAGLSLKLFKHEGLDNG